MILAIDPGVTTGIALLSETGDVIQSCEADLDNLRQILRDMMCIYRPTVVVVDKIFPSPAGKLSRLLRRVESIVELECGRVEWISSGTWKPMTKCKLQFRQFSSRHVQDAVKLGLWRLANGGSKCN